MRSPDEIHASELLKRWRSQIGPRLLMQDNLPRPAIAAGYLVNGPVVEDLVCIEDQILTVLYDEQRGDGNSRIRLAGYGGRAIAWGAGWGGRSLNKFDKDLSLPPERCARGPRIELTRVRLLQHGLELDHLVTANASATDQQSAVRLPTLWAAFRPADGRTLKPSGPEFESLRQRLAVPASELAASYRRRCLGLTLLPMEWVSHAWQRWVTLFADLSQYPKYQCLRRCDPEQQLRGFSGAVRFDFLASRFAGGRSGSMSIPAQPHLARA